VLHGRRDQLESVVAGQPVAPRNHEVVADAAAGQGIGEGRIAVRERRDGFVVLATDEREDRVGVGQDSVQERVAGPHRGVAAGDGQRVVDRPTDHRACRVEHGQ
jgi:hypothetical protein